MASSPSDAMAVPGPLPTLWRSMVRAYRAEPRLVAATLLLVILTAAPDALFALWLKFLAQGVIDHHDTLTLAAALGLGGSVAGGWLLQVVDGRVQRKFRMRVGVALEAHVAELQASIVSIELQERPEYLDRLAVLRDQVFQLDHMYASLFSTLGAVLRLAITVALLASVHPAMLLLALCAVPTVAVSSWRSGVRRAVEERAAPDMRLARHYFLLGTTASPGKEVRLAGIGGRLVEQRRAAWEAWYRPVAATHWRTAAWQAGAWALFGAGYVGAVVFAAAGLHASPGNVLLVLAAGARLSQYVSMTAGEADFLRMWLDASQRLGWLEAYARAHGEGADLAAPERLATGIRFEGVSFRYPGTERDVLRDVTLDLPAGAVIAVVGENGAGKTTLVKLLARMYEPTRGRITVDGVDLARIPADAWRARLAGAFQDFARFEFRVQQTVGVGDLARVEEPVAAGVAVGRAGAEDVVERLPRGLETQLGVAWDDGVEPSFGQWQKLALARGFMRDAPLLLVLDEPTAALDAETEHALFERFVAETRGEGAQGRITILVSHRFSTVRMADLIVVLDGARVVEVGSHEALMARGGQYAELYGIQARAYR
jgi:ATP-binding cassette, subfamily B, bacterial